MYWSEVKHLLRYLIYNCDDAKTYISLALTCKYASELVKYYSPMKMREFSRKIDNNYSMGTTSHYILPNGRILKSKDEALDLIRSVIVETSTFFDIKNNTSFEVQECSENLYEPNYFDYHIEYLFHIDSSNKEQSLSHLTTLYKHYVIHRTYMYIRNKSLHLECERCPYCNAYHTFRFNTVVNGLSKEFYLSSYCGMKLKYYITNYFRDSFFIHNKRRTVVHAIIEYAKKLKNDHRK